MPLGHNNGNIKQYFQNNYNFTGHLELLILCLQMLNCMHSRVTKYQTTNDYIVVTGKYRFTVHTKAVLLTLLCLMEQLRVRLQVSNAL